MESPGTSMAMDLGFRLEAEVQRVRCPAWLNSLSINGIVLNLFALFQKLKVFISGHFGGSHVTPDYFSVYFFVGRDNNRPADSCFNIGAVISFLPVKNKTSFLEDALKGFPVDGS